MNSAYDFSFESLLGDKNLSLSEFQRKVMLIVNTASKCGFTKQYADLETLYNTYKDQGLMIIGVPCDDFGHQEPGSHQEIAEFCNLNYGVTFPMTQTEHVKGEHVHPFYQWAKETLGFGTAPKWNFHKYLIDKNGHLVDYFNSTTNPMSDRVRVAIEQYLAES